MKLSVVKEHGVDLAFSKALQSIEDRNGMKQVVFADGKSISCDMVMMHRNQGQYPGRWENHG